MSKKDKPFIIHRIIEKEKVPYTIEEYTHESIFEIRASDVTAYKEAVKELSKKVKDPVCSFVHIEDNSYRRIKEAEEWGYRLGWNACLDDMPKRIK